MRTTFYRLIFVLTMLHPLSAQEGKIVANPEAVTLREIWRARGAIAGGDLVGDGIGGGFDINDDGIGDFAVRFGKTGEWKVYLGSTEQISDTAVWSFRNSAGIPYYPVAGDFWGTGHKALGFTTGRQGDSNNGSVIYYNILLYRTESGSLPDTPSAIIDPEKTMSPRLRYNPRDILVADLDGDSADEMVVVSSVGVRDGVRNSYREIWIFRGGPDFPGDTPTLLLQEVEENTDEFGYPVIGDLDGDHHLDLLIAGIYPDGAKLKIYFGSQTSPWSWSEPDRTISLSSNGHPRIGYGLTLLDADGDGISDLLLPGPDGRIYLFRSRGTGKNARTRSYDIADGDNSYFTGATLLPAQAGAPMNDASERYDMMMLVDDKLMAFGGGPYGPDASYEGTYRDGLGGVFWFTRSIGDVNGDGWSDYMCANPRWWGLDQGIALILAGGPYIPHNDTTLTVKDISAESHIDAISIWPNPVRESLKIGWRGDLHRPPTRFEIHNLFGERIASGNIDPSASAVHWQCRGTANGSYFLSVFDQNGALIASTSVIIQH